MILPETSYVWSPFEDQERFCKLVLRTANNMLSWSENSDIEFAMERFKKLLMESDDKTICNPRYRDG
jgi:hypothetical protein